MARVCICVCCCLWFECDRYDVLCVGMIFSLWHVYVCLIHCCSENKFFKIILIKINFICGQRRVWSPQWEIGQLDAASPPSPRRLVPCIGHETSCARGARTTRVAILFDKILCWYWSTKRKKKTNIYIWPGRCSWSFVSYWQRLSACSKWVHPMRYTIIVAFLARPWFASI